MIWRQGIRPVARGPVPPLRHKLSSVSPKIGDIDQRLVPENGGTQGHVGGRIQFISALVGNRGIERPVVHGQGKFLKNDANLAPIARQYFGLQELMHARTRGALKVSVFHQGYRGIGRSYTGFIVGRNDVQRLLPRVHTQE